MVRELLFCEDVVMVKIDVRIWTETVSFGFRDEVGYDVCQKFQGANFDVDT